MHATQKADMNDAAYNAAVTVWTAVRPLLTL